MSPTRSLLRAGVGLAISAVSIYLVSLAISVDDTVRVLMRASWEGVGAVMLFIGIDVLIRSSRWRVLLRPLARLSRPTVLGHLLIGYLANNALPGRLGELVRAYSLGDREGISRSAVVGTVVVERLLDVGVLAFAVLLGLTVVASGAVIFLAAVSGLIVAVAGLAILVALSGDGPHQRWLDRVRAGRARSVLHGLMRGFSVIRSRAVLLEAVLLTAIAWTVTAIAFQTAGTAVDVDLSVMESLLFAAAVNLATAIPAGPGYIGTFELAAVSIAAAMGISPIAGLAMAVIVHSVTLLMTTLGGAASLFVFHVAPVITRPRTSPVSESLAAITESDRPPSEYDR